MVVLVAAALKAFFLFVNILKKYFFYFLKCIKKMKKKIIFLKKYGHDAIAK
jgi:hypothetical protein